MFSIKPLPQFSAWLDGLGDMTVRGAVLARIKRLQLGLMGDVDQGIGDAARLNGGNDMNKRIKVDELPEFDAARYLDSEEAIAAYLSDILAANDPALLAAALGDIARARGMSEIAKASGITREALYKALRPDAQPRFDTVSRVCAALGVKLVAQPVHA
jgi:probable addiction module antidote protein